MLKKAFYVISVCVDIYAFIVGINDISHKISKEPSPLLMLVIWIVFVLTLLFSVAYTIYLIVKLKCQNCGTHKIPCSIYAYYRAKIRNKTKTAIYAMHMIYHCMYEEKQKIHNADIDNDIDSIKSNVNRFLENAGWALRIILGIEINISVKLASQHSGNDILETYTYVIGKMNANKRHKFNKYILDVNLNKRYVDLHSCCLASRQYALEKGNSEYATNSVFNYLLLKGGGYWLSNDLDLDEKNEMFYSSSDYRKCYCSLGIFAIKAPKLSEDVGLLHSKGFLTFDSEKPNLFVENECQQLMGFIAHCLFEILIEYNYAACKKNQKQKK